MSWWTYVNGLIMVEPVGCTQPEKRYILETVLAHLPKDAFYLLCLESSYLPAGLTQQALP